jgi:hypothetical protein
LISVLQNTILPNTRQSFFPCNLYIREEQEESFIKGKTSYYFYEKILRLIVWTECAEAKAFALALRSLYEAHNSFPWHALQCQLGFVPDGF